MLKEATKMKKILAIITSLIMILGVTTNAFAVSKFTDIKDSNWACPYINKLVEKGGIKGYSDGTFKAQNTITAAEFVKTIIALIDGEKSPLESDNHWASGYMDTAIFLNIMPERFIPRENWDKPISRENMGTIMERTAELVNKEYAITDETKLKSIQVGIKDYDSICEDCKDYIAQAVGRGLITGYSDGTFKPQKTATRAEATTMIVRLIDKSFRATELKKENHEQSIFTITYKSGKSTVLPQKTATLSDLQITKIDVYNGNQIRVFSKIEQNFAVLVGNNFTTDTISPTSNYWDVDGYKMYLFTSLVNPSGKEIRIVLGNTAYLLQGVNL